MEKINNQEGAVVVKGELVHSSLYDDGGVRSTTTSHDLLEVRRQFEWLVL